MRKKYQKREHFRKKVENFMNSGKNEIIIKFSKKFQKKIN